MYSSIANNMYSYMLTMGDFRDALSCEVKPSWIKITTITMISQFLTSVDIPKLRKCFQELGSMKLKMKKSKRSDTFFEWTMKNTEFYNQVTIGYHDGYSKKSIKVFPNGSIQVAGCSDLFDCNRIIKQLSYIFKICLGLDKEIPTDSFRVVMINTNFSLNYKVNLFEVSEHFSKNKNFNVSFNPDRYSAVKIKFKPADGMKEVTTSIFSTGKIIVTGAETLKEIVYSYNIINQHINSNNSIKVQKTTDVDVFDMVMGYKIYDWIHKLKTKNIKSWKFTSLNNKINF